MDFGAAGQSRVKKYGEEKTKEGGYHWQKTEILNSKSWIYLILKEKAL